MLVLVAALSCAGGDAALFDGPKAFYRLDVLPRFDLHLTPAARADLTRRPREWTRAELRYGALRFTVGLRLKGHRSLRALDDKPSFKVKMDHVVSKQRFFGMKGLVFNNLVEDPTMVREILAYRLHRALGVPAPDVAYARVSLDGEYVGLYLFVEPIDKRFLDRHFDDDGGQLFEGEYGCDLYPADVDHLQLETGPPDREPLRQLVAAAGGSVERLIGGPAARFDRSALSYLAVSAVVGDFDGYRHAHNYRLYHEPTVDRWYFIPWGLDRAMKRSLDVYDSAGVVARRCFADRACRIAYLEELRRAADALERFGFDRGIEFLYAFIGEAAKADAKKPYDGEKVRAARAELVDFLRRRPAEVRAALACLEDGVEVDRDGDGHGCMDCDDRDRAVHPGAAEVCDRIDNDCSGVVDDAACPCTPLAIDGARYELCEQRMGWDAAAAMCAAKGGHLARIESAAASRAIHAAATRLVDDRWWIGLRAPPGQLSWADGAPPTGYHGFRRGEPDDAGCSQDCVALVDGAAWADEHCARPAPFVCRF